jgi:hypothetical protein
LLERLMIGKWMSLPYFFRCCTWLERDEEVKISCDGSKRRLFKFKSFYFSLVCSEGCCFPWKSVWWTKAPLKAAIFAWLAVLSKIIMDNFFCLISNEYVVDEGRR